MIKLNSPTTDVFGQPLVHQAQCDCPACESTKYKAGTGWLGSTESGQKVKAEDLKQLPPGAVVLTSDTEGNSWLIHLHDDLWMYISGCCHLYDNSDRMKRYLNESSQLSHLPLSYLRSPHLPLSYLRSPIECLSLSPRTQRLLKNSVGVSQLWQLAQIPTANLCRWLGIGKKSLANIETALAAKGLSLGMCFDEALLAQLRPPHPLPDPRQPAPPSADPSAPQPQPGDPPTANAAPPADPA